MRQDFSALDRHRLRHDENEPVAARRRDECEADARIAGGRLDEHRFARLDAAFRFERVDHRDADAILDRRQRVEEFELQQNVGIELRCRLDLRKSHERRMADGFGDAVVDAAASPGLRGCERFDFNRVCHGLSRFALGLTRSLCAIW